MTRGKTSCGWAMSKVGAIAKTHLDVPCLESDCMQLADGQPEPQVAIDFIRWREPGPLGGFGASSMQAVPSQGKTTDMTDRKRFPPTILIVTKMTRF